jgi:GT2 family glycosyltransferase
MHLKKQMSFFMENNDISVIVCTKDRSNNLINLLDSLCNQTRIPDELIIVDASQNDDTQNMLEQRSDQLLFDVVYKRTSPGAARQRNIGFTLSRGNYLFFFDDDVVIDSDYIRIIEGTFAHHKEEQLGGMTGRITNIKQSSKAWVRFFLKFFFLTDLGQGKIKLSGFPSPKIDEKAAHVEFLSGCNMVYPRKVFSQFQFDEALTGYSYMEDVDLSFRVRQKYLLYYQPKAKLKHYSTTYKTHDPRALRKMMIQNHRYLFKKNQRHDLAHILSHWFSILGVFFYNVFIQRNLSAGLGIIEGLKDPKNVKKDF